MSQGPVGRESGDAGAAEPGSVRQQAHVRKRLLRLGAAALTDSELLCLLFVPRPREHRQLALAESLLSTGGGLKALLQREPQELCVHPGLGPIRTAQVLAALELGRRAQHARDLRPRLQTPEDVHAYLLPSLSALRREEFHVLYFNTRNALLHHARVGEGGADTCAVDPREVFAPAVGLRASGVVLAHNHPSGDPEPSEEDVSLTQQLAQAGGLLCVRVLDHLILGDDGFVSLAKRGVISHSRRRLSCAECLTPFPTRSSPGPA